MVIVSVTVILGEALLEPLLQLLDFEVDVDQAEYMAEWHRRRELTGTLYTIEEYIYSCVVLNAEEEESEEEDPPAPPRRNGPTQNKNPKGAIPKNVVQRCLLRKTWLLTPSPKMENGDRERFPLTG